VLHIHADTPQWLQSTHNMAGLDVEKVGYTAKQFGIGARDALILMGVWTAIGGTTCSVSRCTHQRARGTLEAAQLDGAVLGAAFAASPGPVRNHVFHPGDVDHWRPAGRVRAARVMTTVALRGRPPPSRTTSTAWRSSSSASATPQPSLGPLRFRVHPRRHQLEVRKPCSRLLKVLGFGCWV